MADWDKRWMELASLASTWSKDPDTKVGAAIINKYQDVIGIGWNGYPKGVIDTLVDRTERPLKYKWMEHAERNAIYDAASQGSSTRNARLYTTKFPCTDCARAIIQCGISMVISPAPDFNHDRWGQDTVESNQMLAEGGIVSHIYTL